LHIFWFSPVAFDSPSIDQQFDLIVPRDFFKNLFMGFHEGICWVEWDGIINFIRSASISSERYHSICIFFIIWILFWLCTCQIILK
jgi:hypothetical protein